jgi:hypothetical protein
MRNVIQSEVKSNQIIVSIDNVGAVGMKADDIVKASYLDVAYFGARTTIIECFGANSIPFSINIGNFCGDQHFQELHQGVEKALNEAGLVAQINGSSESNFDLKQSAVTITTLGWKQTTEIRACNYSVAVIGYPLVGDEVLTQPEKIITLNEVKTLMENQFVYDLRAVGSKGIKYELSKLSITEFDVALDIHKSGGPSTAVIITYHPDIEEQLKAKHRLNFNKVNIV